MMTLIEVATLIREEFSIILKDATEVQGGAAPVMYYKEEILELFDTAVTSVAIRVLNISLQKRKKETNNEFKRLQTRTTDADSDKG